MGSKYEHKSFFYAQMFSLRSCRSSSVIFLILGGKSGRKFGGNFMGFSEPPKNKAQKSQDNIRSIFREKIQASKKSFVPTSFCRRATLSKCFEHTQRSGTRNFLRSLHSLSGQCLQNGLIYEVDLKLSSRF